MSRVCWTVWLVVAMSALPIAPVRADGHDAGAFMGTAFVGKAADPLDPCTPDGGAGVVGPGLGVPLVNAPKFAFFAFVGDATTVLHGTGPLLLCGDLYPVGSNLPTGGIGAACGMSKAVGEGSYAFPGTLAHPGPGVVFLTNVMWKASAGGEFVATASYGPLPPAPPAGTVLAYFRAAGGALCLTKSDAPPKSGGGTAFTVLGALAFVPGVVLDVNGVVPLGLGGKCAALPPCLYGPK